MAGRGRPTREPTAAERKKVKEFVSEGASRRVIAAALDCSVPTLRKLFPLELGLEKKSPAAETAPPFKITAQMQADVALMAACNEPQARIARAIGVSEADLRKHFADDLDTGAARFRLKTLRKLDTLADAGVFGAAQKLLAITSPVAENAPVAAGYLSKKAAAKADAAEASSAGKFAPRSAPRLATSDGKPVT